MENALRVYNETNRKLKAFGYADFIISWDMQTEAPLGADHSAEMAALSEMQYALSTSDEYTGAIKTLYENRDKLDPVIAHEVRNAWENVEQLKKIPMDEYVAFSSLTNEFYNVYVDAKRTNDFAKALPYYEKIVAYRRKYAKWLETDETKGYNVMLNDFERGLTTDDLDKFFSLLKSKLVPLIRKIGEKGQMADYSFAAKDYPVAGQKKFQDYLGGVIGFNNEYTVKKESEHPFTNGVCTTDVRITNHFRENEFTRSIYSAIHEMGHGMYELQCDKSLDKTMSGGGAGMAMHESQSRFLENMIGRSKAFWETHFDELKRTFPEQLDGVTAKDLWLFVNKVEPSLVRTEADELTYSLHIMVRYEMEKALLSGEIEAKDIPAKWNALYKEYLGIDVPNDTDGCLQDVHWAYGEFGYFPTYALGSAYAAQIYHAMSRDLDIDAEIKTGSFAGIESWLKEHIHKYGASMDSRDILKLATGEDFNPQYYVDYLVGKYSEIYGIEMND